MNNFIAFQISVIFSFTVSQFWYSRIQAVTRAHIATMVSHIGFVVRNMSAAQRVLIATTADGIIRANVARARVIPATAAVPIIIVAVSFGFSRANSVTFWMSGEMTSIRSFIAGLSQSPMVAHMVFVEASSRACAPANESLIFPASPIWNLVSSKIPLYSACRFCAIVSSQTQTHIFSAYSFHITETFLVTHALSTSIEFSFLIPSVAVFTFSPREIEDCHA